MGLISRVVGLAISLAGLAVGSQAPEFAQQYRQRLGGAVEELRSVVTQFDADAASSGLSRELALQRMIGDEQQLVRDRGVSMTAVTGRFERLAAQQSALEQTDDLLRPFHVLRSPDTKIVSDAWEIFKPAVPLTIAGAVWGGVGAVVMLVAWLLGLRGARAMRRQGLKGVDTVAAADATAAGAAGTSLTQPEGMADDVTAATDVEPIDLDPLSDSHDAELDDSVTALRRMAVRPYEPERKPGSDR